MEILKIKNKQAMEFKKYMHLERFGNTEVQNIELGECYIFPKIDGTNASVWVDGQFCLKAGSRNRELTLDKDNAGFYSWVTKGTLLPFFKSGNKNLRLYGEWLVPHSLKTYREDCWRQFYVFDVMDKNGNYLHYTDYQPLLEEHNINYIPPIKIIKNGSYEDFVYQMNNNNNYLIQDGKGMGEGVVIKNYSFVNKYGRTTWAKIVTSEFKERHTKVMGAPVQERGIIEEEIVKDFITKSLCEKVFAKIGNEAGDWKSQYIPRLLNTIYYDLIKEDMWEIVKNHKNPTINFKTLEHFTFKRVKEQLPKIF